MKKQMRMRIDQARHQRPVAEIDDLRARWTLDTRAGSSDMVALDENLSRAKDAAGLGLIQPGRMQNRLFLLCEKKGRGKKKRRQYRLHTKTVSDHEPILTSEKCRSRIESFR